MNAIVSCAITHPFLTIDKVIQFVKSIFYRFSIAMGFIKIDEEAIDQQKQKVQDFLLQKAEQVKKGTTGELDALSSKIKLLTTEQSTLSSKILSSKEEIKQTTQNLETGKENLSKLNEVSQKLKNAQRELEESEKRVKASQSLEKTLSQQVEIEKRNVSSIKEEYRTLEVKKKQVDNLKREFEHWNNKVQSAKTKSQIDYKKKAEEAEAEISELKRQLYETQQLCLACGFHPPG